jgi:hypothetical protein
VSDGFLKEIGRSYIVSSFLPAAFFVSIGYFLFQGFIPLGILKQILASGDISNYLWLGIFNLVVWVAFYLYSANDVTVRLFEGYLMPESFYKKKETLGTQIEWEAKNLRGYTAWKKEKEQLDKIDTVTEVESRQHFISMLSALAEIANVNLRKPLNVSSQMPTRLGNVLRSSEVYALERYNIFDGAIWPRLLPVLPVDIKKHLEEKNNLFMFLLNSAFLAYFLALASAIFGLIIPHINFPEGFFYIGYEFISAANYIWLSVLFLIFGYLLYLVAVNAAEDFTMYVRSSFDLYRINLLRQLHWDPPKTLEAEKNLWLEVSKLLIAGSRIEADFSDFTRKFQLENKTPSSEVETKEN